MSVNKYTDNLLKVYDSVSIEETQYKIQGL